MDPGDPPVSGEGSRAIAANHALTSRDQARADADQTASDTDQTAAESDQAAADLDQAAAESDQAASDRDLAHGSDPRVHSLSRDLRERSAQQRQQGAEQRTEVAADRDQSAHARDLAALSRDRAAELHDRRLAERDAARGGAGEVRAKRLGRASQDRQRAAADRVAAAEGRARASLDREYAAHDREQAARDRSQAHKERDALLARLTIIETEERTARGRAEEALRESEERYRLLAQNSSDVITRVSSDAIVSYVSPASRSVFGHEPEEMVGRAYSWAIHPEERDAVRDAVAAFMAGSGDTATYEYRTWREDGTYVWVESRMRRLSSPVAGARLGEFQCATRDITERKHADAETERAREEVERANRAKSEFVSRVSHELRTPLNAIIGFGQVLDLQPLSLRQHEEVEHILKAGEHLLALINDVLDISRIEAGGLEPYPEPVLVAETVREALALVAPIAAQRNLRISADMQGGVDRYVNADRRLLAQVLLNLLSNAIKYNCEGGRIDVSFATSENGRIRMLVADTGPGIEPERLTRVFEPFDRLGAEFTDIQGSGLGLALSKTLVEAMGGSLVVESTLGLGSTFIVELEAAQAPARAEQMSSLSEPARVTDSELGLDRRRILYIEDNLANLTLVERILDRQAAVELIPAMQGRLGLELARDHQPDLIVLDVHLPDLAGIEVLRRLKAHESTREIPVVVLSADASVKQIKALRDAGACDYLTKPLDMRRFLEILAANLRVQEHPRAPDCHARIIIVDDVQANVALLETLLGAWGYDNLVGTTNSSTALRLCLEHEPDLLLLDLQMPSPSGYEVMEALGHTDVPILVLTANLSKDAQARARDLGATDFASKPFAHDELRRQIASLL